MPLREQRPLLAFVWNAIEAGTLAMVKAARGKQPMLAPRSSMFDFRPPRW